MSGIGVRTHNFHTGTCTAVVNRVGSKKEVEMPREQFPLPEANKPRVRVPALTGPTEQQPQGAASKPAPVKDPEPVPQHMYQDGGGP